MMYGAPHSPPKVVQTELGTHEHSIQAGSRFPRSHVMAPVRKTVRISLLGSGDWAGPAAQSTWQTASVHRQNEASLGKPQHPCNTSNVLSLHACGPAAPALQQSCRKVPLASTGFWQLPMQQHPGIACVFRVLLVICFSLL